MTHPPLILQPLFDYGFVPVYLIFGLSGFILGWSAQRGNYCFVNAMSSLFTTKDTERFGGILLLFGLSALLPGLLVAGGVVPPVDQYYFNYFSGWYIVVGAFIFGFGAAIAGGCNLSMLYRAASGYIQNWIELFGMMLGTYIFAVGIWPFQLYTMTNGILSTTNGGYIEYLPWLIFHSVAPWAVGASAFVLGVPFIGLGLYLQRRSRKAWKEYAENEASLRGMRRASFSPLPSPSGQGGNNLRLSTEIKDIITLKKPMGTNLTTIILALDMVMVFVFGAGYTFNYLVITSSDGGRFLEYLLFPFGINLASNTTWYNTVLPIVDPTVLMVIMLIIGAFSASYLSGDFKIRIPREKKRMVIGFLGGILVGIGVRMALGCNVGLMWTNFAQLGYDGILFLIAMLGGVALAIKVQDSLM